jgi:hypothetical protein
VPFFCPIRPHQHKSREAVWESPAAARRIAAVLAWGEPLSQADIDALNSDNFEIKRRA